MPTGKGVVATEVYTEKDAYEALTALALHNGRRKYASEATGIPENTISNWAYSTKRDEYQKIRKELKNQLREQEIEKHLAVAANARNLADEMVDLTRGVVDKIEPRDLPGAARNMATVSGIHTTKATELAEGVSEGSAAGRSVKDILRALDGKGVKLTLDIAPSEPAEKPEKAVESTAKEITDGA